METESRLAITRGLTVGSGGEEEWEVTAHDYRISF